METKFALHDGWVTSQNDGDRHRVPASRLVQLYDLRPGEWFLWAERDDRQGRWENYRHLFPRTDGRYGRPTDGR